MSGCDLLVTGAGGFVGRHLLARARDAGLTAVAFEGDVRDRDSAEAQVAQAAPRWVVHLASPAREHGADAWSLLDDELAMAASLLAAVATHAPAAVVLFAGSAAQYGRGLPRPLREEDPTEPLTVYGAAKCVLERTVTAEPFNRGVRVVFTRSFNHVGPGQPAGAPVADWARQDAEAERRGGGTLVTGRLDSVRDFLDVRDVADAYIALVRAEHAGVVNVCSGRARALEEIAGALRDLSVVPLELVRDPALERALDPPHVVGDPSRLSALTGFSPGISLEHSLRDALDQWRASAAEDAEHVSLESGAR